MFKSVKLLWVSALFALPAAALLALTTFQVNGRLGPEFGGGALHILLHHVLGGQAIRADHRLVQRLIGVQVQVQRVFALQGGIKVVGVVLGALVEFQSVLFLSDLAQHIYALLQLLCVQGAEFEDLPVQSTEIYLFESIIEVDRLGHECIQIIVKLLKKLDGFKLPHFLH